MANARNYSNTSVNTTLNGAITNVGTNVVLTSQTGMPTPPFVLSIEPDTVNEELVLVNSGSGTGGSPYVVTRGYDGTTNIAHSSLVAVQHRISAVDFTDSRTHEAASGNVHGLLSGINVVGATGGLTANTVLTNTLTKTAIGKTYSVAGSTASAGDFYRITVFGTAVCTGTPNLIFNLQYGTNILATSDTIDFTVTGTTYFQIVGLVDFQSVGGSGSLGGSLQVHTTFSQSAPSTDALFRDRLSLHSAGLLTGISTTSTQLLQVMATWSAASSSNILTAIGGTVEQVG